MLFLQNGFAQSFTCGTGLNDTLYDDGSFPDTLGRPASAVCSATSTAYQNRWTHQSNYIPDTDDPVVTIKFVLHILRKNDQSGEWQPSDLPYLKYLFSTVLHTTTTLPQYENTDRYSVPRTANYTVPGFTSPTSVIDSKIRYELTNVYFWDNTTIYNTNNRIDGLNNIYTWLAGAHPVELREGVPIVFTKANNTPWVKHQGTGPMFYCGFPPANSAGDTSFVRTQFRHEFGHCLGLAHPYMNPTDSVPAPGELHLGQYLPYYNPCGTKNYLSDLFAANNPTCSLVNVPVYYVPNACGSCYEWFYYSNNVMHNFSSNNRWMSPLQMGRRTMQLHLFPIRRHVKDMTSNHLNPWQILVDETWDFDIQLYKDILVTNGTKLTIKCKVWMPIDGKIIVEKGGQLVIDGGEISTWCKSGTWGAIEVEGDPNAPQTMNYSTGFATYQGVLKIINGGKLSNAGTAVTNYRTTTAGHIMYGNIGGIIIANEAQFINNARDVEFMGYTPNSASTFYKCVFKTTGLIGGTQVPAYHVTIWGCRNIKFNGCTFEYAAGNLYTPAQHGKGIFSMNGSFLVDKLCSSSGSPCITPTLFKNLNVGIYSDNINPQYVATIKNSRFENNDQGAYFRNMNLLAFENNYIKVPGSWLYTGLYLNQCKYYNVKNNTFLQDAPAGMGIVAYDSREGAHQVYKNSFANFLVGIDAVDNNAGVNNVSDGLQMNCNDFTPVPNTYDIALLNSGNGYGAMMPSVKHLQGAILAPDDKNVVRNKYGVATCNNNNMWFIDPSSSVLIDHGSHINNLGGSLTSPPQPGCASALLNVVTYNATFDYEDSCPSETSSTGGTGGSREVRLENINSYLGNLFAQGDDADPFELQATMASKLNYYFTDTLSSALDTVIQILSGNSTHMADADIQLAYTYIAKQDFASAYTLVSAMGADRADWKTLLLKLISIYQEPDQIFSIDSNATDLAYITSLADSVGKDGRGVAQTILKAVRGIDYEIPLVVPEGEEESRLMQSIEIKKVSQEQKLIIYPNPAKEGFMIYYNAPSNEQALVEINDLLGRQICSKFISGMNETYFPFDDCENGVYIVTITQNRKLIFKTKLVKNE